MLRRGAGETGYAECEGNSDSGTMISQSRTHNRRPNSFTRPHVRQRQASAAAAHDHIGDRRLQAVLDGESSVTYARFIGCWPAHAPGDAASRRQPQWH